MDAEQRKKQILTCAKKLFASKGYYQAQISDIQHAAGVARGTIYQYFKNKDDIFETILENLFLEWKNALDKKPETDSEDLNNGFNFFRFKIRSIFEFFDEDPDYCNILLRVGLGLGENFDKIIRRFDIQMVGLANNYLSAGIKQNRIKPDIDLELLSNLMGGAIMRTAYYYGVTKKVNDIIDVNLLTESFVNAFAYGIFVEKS